jgi:hypothetical protein
MNSASANTPTQRRTAVLMKAAQAAEVQEARVMGIRRGSLGVGVAVRLEYLLLIFGRGV